MTDSVGGVLSGKAVGWVGLDMFQASVFLWPHLLGLLFLRGRDPGGPAPSILDGGGQAKNH